MRRPRSPFYAEVVGPPDFERYVIRQNFVEPPTYYRGPEGESWTENLREARLYADLDWLSVDLWEINRRELAHLPQRTYWLDMEVLAIGEATPEQVRDYLADALRIGLDHDGHGPGPGLGTVIQARAMPWSLRDDGEAPDADGVGLMERDGGGS